MWRSDQAGRACRFLVALGACVGISHVGGSAVRDPLDLKSLRACEGEAW